ncbi:MAG TPA: MFS transporter [Gaiellaceae bacterium]
MSEATIGAEARARRRRRWQAPEGSLWRHGDFNRLWFGQSISVLGSEITTLALPLTAIVMLGASAFQIGLLNAFGSVATLFFMLFAGAIVDRVRRRRVMVVADLGRAALIGLIPILAAFGHLSMPILYAVVVFVGAFTVLFELAYFAYLPTIVEKDDLVPANARLQGSESFGGIAGGTLGGSLVTIFRPAYALIGDAISFVVSAVSLLMIRRPERPVERPKEDVGNQMKAVLKDIGAGIGPNFRNAYLRPLTFNSATANFLAQIVLTLFVLYAARDLKIPPLWIGVIFAAGSAGGVVGALLTSFMTRRFGFGRTLIGSMLAYRVIIVTPLIAGPKSLVIVLLAITWFVTVVGVVMGNISQGTLRQVVTPDELMGRVMGAHRTLAYGTVPLAALVAGFLGSAIGVRTTMLITTVLLPLTLGWVLSSPIPRLRTVHDAVADQAEPEPKD